MPTPVKQKTWIITANQRIPILSYATLVLQGGRWLRVLAITMLANGYTCKGSSNGAAAAMDGTNRWTTDGAASVQAANTTTAVSWMVLTDGNGCNICLAFVGATGNIARISFSPGGVYVVAGTATFTPTAADEIVLFTGTSLLGTSLTDDRVVHIWIDSQAKLMRTCVFSAGALLGGTWGVELVNANRITLAFSPAVWGFAFVTGGMQATSGGLFAAFAANTNGGIARINGTAANCFCGVETLNSNPALYNGVTKPELQKAIGQTMWPISIGSTTSTRQGPIGDLFDWYIGGAGSSVGGSGPANLVGPGCLWMTLPNPSANNGVAAWPWDGTTSPESA